MRSSKLPGQLAPRRPDILLSRGNFTVKEKEKMTFGSIFKSAKGLFDKATPFAVSVIDTIDPAVAPLVNLVYNTILKAEGIATLDNANKKQLVLDETANAIPLLQAGLAQAGKSIDAAKVQSAIGGLNDAYVAFLKAYAAVHDAVSTTTAIPALAK